MLTINKMSLELSLQLLYEEHTMHRNAPILDLLLM